MIAEPDIEADHPTQSDARAGAGGVLLLASAGLAAGAVLLRDRGIVPVLDQDATIGFGILLAVALFLLLQNLRLLGRYDRRLAAFDDRLDALDESVVRARERLKALN